MQGQGGVIMPPNKQGWSETLRIRSGAAWRSKSRDDNSEILWLIPPVCAAIEKVITVATDGYGMRCAVCLAHQSSEKVKNKSLRTVFRYKCAPRRGETLWLARGAASMRRGSSVVMKCRGPTCVVGAEAGERAAGGRASKWGAIHREPRILSGRDGVP